MIDRATRGLLLILAVFTSALPAYGNPVMRVPGEPAPVVTKDATLLELRTSDYPDTAVAEVLLPEIAPQKLERMRERNSGAGADALQIGIDRLITDEAPEKALPHLQWLPLATGGWVSHFAATSPGAAALRIQLSSATLPDGAELRFVGNGQSHSVVDPVTVNEVNGIATNSSTYWSPVTAGDRQLVEIYVSGGAEPTQVGDFVIAVAHLYESPYGSPTKLKTELSDFCQVDANCAPSPPASYVNSKNAVAHMVYQEAGGTFSCTGTLLNDTDTTTRIPYLFSANHCIDTQLSANTLSTFWFKESASCGSATGISPVQVAGGAVLLVGDPATDTLLLRLNNPAPSGVWFNGWDPSPVNAGATMLVFHHPRGDVKKITLGQTLGFGGFNGAGSYIKAGYDAGATESGSSGAGLLTLDGSELFLRGGLRGGSTFCSSPGAGTDSYSRLDISFQRLEPFLAPSGQSQVLNVSRVGSGVGTLTSNPVGINCGIICSAAFSSGASVTLTATPFAGSTFTGWSGDCSGVGSCVVVMSQARNVTANFTQSSVSQVLNVSRVGSGVGTLTSNPVGINCGIICSAAFSSGASVTLTATPFAGSTFTGWSGDCSGVGSCVVAMSQARNVTATFSVIVSGVDEPTINRVALPPPNPANASCPSGFFVATVGDGPGTGLTSGAFGLELLLDDPGTRVLAGGLNFGGLIDISQPGFAGFTIANTANEPQRLTLNLTGSPSSSSAGSIQVRVSVARRTPTTTDVVFEATTVITLGMAFVTSIDLSPAFYEVTVSPVSGTLGGSPEGQFYFSLTTSFVNRPGGGFQGGAVVGGYHSTHPFGGVSGFAGFCLATPHSASVRVLSAPSYGSSGARDLRLRILDAQQNPVVSVPGG